MCLLLISYKYHPNYKIIIGANRDEFYNRPSLPAKFWDDKPGLLAGKDLSAGGTWLGITKHGKFAAVTNYRDMKEKKLNAPSRGNLTLEFLTATVEPDDYGKKLSQTASQYFGYNLIFGNSEKLYYFSNKSNLLIELSPGIYGLSNHLLDTPWPKVNKSKLSFNNLINSNEISEGDIFAILEDKSIPSEESLPDTGLSPAIEKAVSPIFVETPQYGTRSSAVIFWNYKDEISFTERALEIQNKKWIESSFHFKVKNI